MTILKNRKKRCKRKVPLKMIVMTPSLEGVSELNKIAFYNDTDSGSWKFVV